MYLALLLAFVAFVVVHEGAHAIASRALGEYQAFHLRWYGFEVEYATPVAERSGAKWGFIAGSSCCITILCAYVLFAARKKLAASGSALIRSTGFYFTVLFLLGDPLNLSVGPFLYGGDIGGLVAGFHLNRYTVQIAFLAVALFNRELIARRILPAFGVQTRHFAFRPWIGIK